MPSQPESYVSVAYDDIGVPAPSEYEYFADTPTHKLPSTVSVKPTTGVYIVRGGGLVKIGLARCVLQRLLTLRSHSPVAIEPVGFIHTPHSYKDAFALERQLHERFAASRSHHEWFNETADLAAFMETHLAAWPIPDAR